jgi:preprotein translocase subunit SecF
MFVIKYKKIIFLITSLYIVAAIFALSIWGLNLSIDFTGGSILEVSFPDGRPEKAVVEEILSQVIGGGFTISSLGENNFSIRTPYLDEAERNQIVQNLSTSYGAVEEKFSSIGPVIGEELKKKAFIALALVAATIILFIAFAFRRVSEPVSSWVYGLIAIIALAHDVLVPTGIFAFLGKFFGIEVGILFITALLTIWGYSVSDTIVVFDRVRENLKKSKQMHNRKNFDEVVGKSLEETYGRSLATSLTTLVALASLYVLGGEATKLFALTLIIGVVAGSYSSIFLASPLLVVFNNWRNRRK